jgi:methyltransferase (TIGR00027 family)
MVAAYRARASRREGAICDDPWAGLLAGADGQHFAARYDQANPNMELWVAVRTAVIDDEVREQTRGPAAMDQVVILGAGLDSRAARLGRAGVRFFEVDHPKSQEDKRERLAQAPAYPVDAAVYVACDLATDDFGDALAAAGFDMGRPAVIVWEGVVHYLTEEQVRATLRRVTSGFHARTTVVFDFVTSRFVHGTSRRAEDLEQRQILAALGEPVCFGTDDAVPILYEAGFRHVRVTSFDEACLSLTGTYDRARAFRFQYIAVASGQAPPRPGS